MMLIGIHVFFRSCIEKVKGKKCPVCNIPSHVCDVQPDRQLNVAVSLCHQLKLLIQGEI